MPTFTEETATETQLPEVDSDNHRVGLKLKHNSSLHVFQACFKEPFILL